MDTTLSSYTWCQFAPEFALVAVAVIILLADSFLPQIPKRIYALVGAAGAFFITCLMARGEYANWFGFLACAATTLTLLLAYDYRKITCESIAGSENEDGTAEFYALPLIACAGICCLGQAKDLIMLFVSLEVITLSSYVLAGYFRRNQGSIEAGVKYLILGAMSTGLLVFGAAWYFGTTGSFDLDPLMAHTALSHGYLSTGFLMATALLLAGALFKVGAAPMHMWIPDVYQGAPTPTSNFLAIASKAAGFAALCLLLRPFRPFAEAYPGTVSILVHSLSIVAAATLLIGNLGAIGQHNAKRLLGYSSIGQAGFILIFFVNLGGDIEPYVFNYLLAYALATAAAFFAIAMLRTQRGSEEISAFRGLGKTNPRTAFLITVSFASLAGVPLTMGFLAKYYSFCALIQAMGSWNGLLWLLPVMIVCAAAGFYYYFKVLRAMYWEKPLESDKPLRVPAVTAAVLTACSIIIILMGTYPLLFS